MSYAARRKAKVEYEPINVIGVGNVEVEVPEEIPDTIPTVGGIHQTPPTTIVTLDTVRESKGIPSVVRLNEQYKEPSKIMLSPAPPIHYEDTVPPPIVSGGEVTNPVTYATEPIDETVDGLPKVFGRRLKEPV